MSPELGELAVEIVRFVDDCQPGIVAIDADDRCHTFIDKIPMFGVDAFLDANSMYPQQGAVRCTVLKHWSDDRGRELVSVKTAYPDGVESYRGIGGIRRVEHPSVAASTGPSEPNSQGYLVWVSDE